MGTLALDAGRIPNWGPGVHPVSTQRPLRVHPVSLPCPVHVHSASTQCPLLATHHIPPQDHHPSYGLTCVGPTWLMGWRDQGHLEVAVSCFLPSLGWQHPISDPIRVQRLQTLSETLSRPPGRDRDPPFRLSSANSFLSASCLRPGCVLPWCRGPGRVSKAAGKQGTWHMGGGSGAKEENEMGGSPGARAGWSGDGDLYTKSWGCQG